MDQQVIATWAQVGVGIGQLVLIAWGLHQMKLSGDRRDRQLDQQDQALKQQGEALKQQGEAMTRAFTQQGEVLAELLRRPA